MEEKAKKIFKGQKWSLEDFIDIKAWQKIQDNFSLITEVGLRTVDFQGRPIIQPSGFPCLCSRLLKGSRLKEKFCGSCLPTFLGGRGVVDRNLCFSCHDGLSNFITPLEAEDKVFGYLMLGPVILVMRKSKEEYRKIAEELELDLEEFWGMLLEIKVVSFQGMRSLIELIKGVGEYTIRLAYQNVVRGKEMIMAPELPKLSKLLNALLEVAFQVTGADIGSIMFFDSDSPELTIQAAKGIPEEIIAKTRVRPGEGISGLAVKEGTPFLIDDKIKDNRIKNYMNRPYLSSSMVVPINVEDKVMGVINLGTLKTSAVRFSSGNLRLVDKLIDLATVALHE